jgi:hypothetical protein
VLALGSIIIGAGACGDSGNGGHLFESTPRKTGAQPGVGGGQGLGDSGGTDSPGDGGTADTLLGGYPPGQGGSPVTGGSSTRTGGAPPGSTGGRSTGGSPPTNTGGSSSSTGPCTWNGGPSSSSGELTCYWFSQGTATAQGCPSYKTYCGYCGTESGSSSGGGACPSGISTSVTNIGTQHFAALKGPGGNFANGKYCGMCVEVSYGGKTITATVVDACATCNSDAHVDLNPSGAVALGLGQGSATGDATNGVTWKTVDCPVTGNIVAVSNNGYMGQFYFQNVAFPVASATAGGHSASQQYAYWDFGTAVGGQQVTLTDSVGHTITGTLPSSGSGNIGKQFPLTCQ